MSDPRLLIHIGYHKTATSWMQSRLFHPKYGYRQLGDHWDLFRHVVQPHGLRFEPGPMQTLIAERRQDLAPGEVPVLSSEILSGHPFQGGHESEVYAERLKAIAPDARILISIRAQLGILPSVYAQYVQRGGTMPYHRFFEGTDELGYFAFTPEHFEYDRLVAHYQQLFGAENVYLMTQESLKADMDGAVADLARFAGVAAIQAIDPADRSAHAPSYPQHAFPVLRRINHVQASTLNPWPVVRLGQTPDGLFRSAGWLLRRPPFSTLFGNRKPVTDYVKRKFTGHYASSNERLANLVAHPIDLSRYEGVQPPKTDAT